MHGIYIAQALSIPKLLTAWLLTAGNTGIESANCIS